MDSKKKKSTPGCQVNSCYNHRKYKTETELIHSFFKIPRSNREEARKNWLEKLNLTEEYLTSTKLKDHYVCDRHFRSKDYSVTKLRFDSVPSLNLNEVCPEIPSSTNKSSEHREVSISKDKRKKIRRKSTEHPLVIALHHSSAETQTEESEFLASPQCCIKSAEKEKQHHNQVVYLVKEISIKQERNVILTKKLKAIKLLLTDLRKEMKTCKNQNKYLKKKQIKLQELVDFKKKDI